MEQNKVERVDLSISRTCRSIDDFFRLPVWIIHRKFSIRTFQRNCFFFFPFFASKRFDFSIFLTFSNFSISCSFFSSENYLQTRDPHALEGPNSTQLCIHYNVHDKYTIHKGVDELFMRIFLTRSYSSLVHNVAKLIPILSIVHKRRINYGGKDQRIINHAHVSQTALKHPSLYIPRVNIQADSYPPSERKSTIENLLSLFIQVLFFFQCKLKISCSKNICSTQKCRKFSRRKKFFTIFSKNRSSNENFGIFFENTSFIFFF